VFSRLAEKVLHLETAVDDLLAEAADAVRNFCFRGGAAGAKRPSVQLSVEDLEERWCPAQITWTNMDGNGLWSDKANWSTQTIPGSLDNVVYDGKVSNANSTVDQNYLGTQVAGITFQDNYSGTLTLSHSMQVNAYSQAGGELTGVGQLTVPANGTFNWFDGTIANTQVNILSGATGGIGSELGVTLNGTELWNSGSLTWSGGELSTQNGGEVNNVNNSKFIITNNDGPAVLASDGTGTVNLNVSSGSTMTVNPGLGNSVAIQGAFKDAGTVSIASGVLELDANSEFSGQANLGSRTSIELNPLNGGASDSAVFDDGSKVSAIDSSGFVVAGAGFVNIQNNPNGQTVGVQIDNLALDTGATIGGLGNLSVNTSFTMNGGAELVSTFTIKPNVNATINTTNAGLTSLLGGSFVNGGTLNWTGPISVLVGTALTNNGTINFNGANLQDGSQGGTPGTLTNNGTMQQQATLPPPATTTSIGIPTTNAGQLNVTDAGFSFGSTLTQSSGSTNLTSPTTFVINGVFTLNGGTLTADSGNTITAKGGIVQNGGTLSMSNSPATLTIAGAFTFNGGNIDLQANGGGNNSDQLNVDGAFTATGGNVNISWINGTPPPQKVPPYALLKYSSITGFNTLNVAKPLNTTFTANPNGTEADLTYTPS
jgi:fibronectin-binding autotransporter adhesin